MEMMLNVDFTKSQLMRNYSRLVEALCCSRWRLICGLNQRGWRGWSQNIDIAKLQ
jgi:hypothetical protein